VAPGHRLRCQHLADHRRWIPASWYDARALERELKTHVAVAKAEPLLIGNDGTNCNEVWQWWIVHKKKLPNFWGVARKLALIQPSSATGVSEGDMLRDQVSAGAMLIFNKAELQ
jgi:hypothetical protein